MVQNRNNNRVIETQIDYNDLYKITKNNHFKFTSMKPFYNKKKKKYFIVNNKNFQ